MTGEVAFAQWVGMSVVAWAAAMGWVEMPTTAVEAAWTTLLFGLGTLIALVGSRLPGWARPHIQRLKR